MNTYERVFAALQRQALPEVTIRAIMNDAFGVSAADPPEVKWRNLLGIARKHLESLTNNLPKAAPDMRALWVRYRDSVAGAVLALRSQDHATPIPQDKRHWQDWVPKTERDAIISAFRHAYGARRGARLIPFAPKELRQEHKARLARLRTALHSVRVTWNTRGTKAQPASHLPAGALMLAAVRQAELAINHYVATDPHPFDNPLKVRWQDYCEPAMRARVRRSIVNPADVDLDGIKMFYRGE